MDRRVGAGGPGKQAQLAGMRNAELIEQRLFGESENGSVRADAQRESENGDGGEAGRFAENAQSVAHVSVERFQPETAALFAAVFFHAFDRAELQRGLAAGFFGREAGGNVRGDLALKVETQLVLHILLP